MKYRVLLKAVYNVYHEVEAESQLQAIDKAMDQQLDIPPPVPACEFADEVVAALVDEDNDPRHHKSQCYFAAGHYWPNDDPEWRL